MITIIFQKNVKVFQARVGSILWIEGVAVIPIVCRCQICFYGNKHHAQCQKVDMSRHFWIDSVIYTFKDTFARGRTCFWSSLACKYVCYLLNVLCHLKTDRSKLRVSFIYQQAIGKFGESKPEKSYVG